MSLGNRVYKGRMSRGSRGPAILLFVLVLILIVGVALFSLLPQYIVYYPERLEMVVPYLQEDGQAYTLEGTTGPEAYPGEVSASVTVAAPDYSDVSLGSAYGLDYMQCLYVPYSKVTSTNIDTVVNEATRSSIKGLCLQMKDESGKLAWMSNVAAASSYATNSAWDITAKMEELKADGWYMVAELSCCVDTAMATADPSAALQDRTGAPYTDELGTWVDPWSLDVRDYIAALCEDLFALGFDEVILTHVEVPASDVVYTRDVGNSLDRATAVMAFSLAVREAVEETMDQYGAHLCVEMDHDNLTADEYYTSSNGQSFLNFLRIYDRIVIPTETYNDDCQVFIDAGIDSTLRFVPQMSWTFGGGSWIKDTT